MIVTLDIQVAETPINHHTCLHIKDKFAEVTRKFNKMR